MTPRDPGTAHGLTRLSARFFETTLLLVLGAAAAECLVMSVLILSFGSVRRAAFFAVAAGVYVAALVLSRAGRSNVALLVASLLSLMMVFLRAESPAGAQGAVLMVIALMFLVASKKDWKGRSVASFFVTMVTLSGVAGWFAIDGDPRGTTTVAWIVLVDQALLIVLATIVAWRLYEKNRRQDDHIAAAFADAVGNARRDPLTGLLNDQAMLEVLAREVARSRRSHRPFAIAVAAVDQYPNLILREGRECAKWVMLTVSDLLRHIVRFEDRLARWDDDRVLILLRETDGDGAQEVARRLQAEVERTAYLFDKREIRFSLTMAITAGYGPLDIDACIAALVDTLENAQTRGGDRVIAVAPIEV